VRDIIALGPDRYHFVRADFLADAEGRFRISGPSEPRAPRPGPIVEAALAAPEVRGLANWLRLPTYQVEARPGGWRVTIRDVRYSRTQSAGLGTAVVELDGALRPVRARKE